MNQHVTATPRAGSFHHLPIFLPLCIPSKLKGIAIFPKGSQVAKKVLRNFVSFEMSSDLIFFNVICGYVYFFSMFIISATEFLFISVVRSSSQLDFRLSRYAPTSQLRTQDDAKEWLRSHSAGGLQDTAANSPFSSGSSVTSPSGTRFNFSQLGE